MKETTVIMQSNSLAPTKSSVQFDVLMEATQHNGSFLRNICTSSTAIFSISSNLKPGRRVHLDNPEAAKACAEDMDGLENHHRQIKNEHHDGHVEGQRMCLIAAQERLIKKLTKQFNESNDRCH